MASASGDLVLRPPIPYRVAGWGFLLFGLFFGLTGIAARDEPDYSWAAGGLMVVSGVFFAHFGLSLFSARAIVSADGIRYRYGLIRRWIPATDVETVVAGPGSGAYYPRVCLHVRCRDRVKPVRLTALQRPDTSAGRTEVEEAALRVSRRLGL